jgi:hypothetical protein
MSKRGVHCCCICRKHFEPHPRLGARQRTCGRDECQKRRRRANSRHWRARNPEGDDATYRRIRQRDRREYRRQYWATHPAARSHHAAYMRRWRARRHDATTCVRDPYRDTALNVSILNTYLKVTDVREANRVLEVKVLSQKDLSCMLHA